MALKNNLRLFLRLNEGSGQSIVDYGPHDFQVNISGTDQRTLVEGQTGTFRNAIQMNKQFYLSIPDNSVLDFTGGYTLHYRLLCNISTGTEYIITKTNDAFSAGYETVVASNFQNMLFNRPLGNNYQPANNISGQWTDIIFRTNYVNGSGQVQLYLNGVSTSFQSFSPWNPADSDRPLTIGSSSTTTASSSNRYSGAIQDVVIYDRGLTDAEIVALSQQHYSSGTTRATSRDKATSAYDFGLGTGTYYKIIGGSDSNVFSVSDAGVLSFNTPPNANSPSDANNDNAYEVTVMLFNDNMMRDETLIISPYKPNRVGTDAGRAVVRAGAFYSPFLTTGIVASTGVVGDLNDRFDDYDYYV